jgi:PAS domain S-box-containing protein
MTKKSLKSSARSRRDSIFEAAPGLETAEYLFDAVGDILFCVKDHERRYVAANDAFAKRAGLRNRTELLGRTASEIFPKILATGYEQQDDEVFSTGKSVRDRLEMITQANGSIGWFVSQKTSVRSTDGKVIALAGISRDLHIPSTRGSELGAIAGVLEKLHRESSQPIRIEDLAKESGLSWSQFQRRVFGITGLTPRQLLTKSRIENAAEALRTTKDSISSIAARCGFYDQAAFCRQFRSITGLTPRDYRQAFKMGHVPKSDVEAIFAQALR